jgi:hypothetical protein
MSRHSESSTSLPSRHGIHVPPDPAATLPFDKLSVLQSQHVILAGRDDPANVATAVRIMEFLAAQQGKRSFPACHVHLFDLRMRQLFARHRLFERNPGAVRFSTFNVYENRARALLEQHHLDHIRITADSERVVRLVVIGFGKMGESLVLQAAKLGHFANGRRLEILVFDREADERKALFLHRYRHIHQVCAIAFWTQDLHSPHTVQDLASLLQGQGRIQTFAFCINNESLNVSVALDLFEELHRANVPALIRMSSEARAPIWCRGTNCLMTCRNGIGRQYATCQNF